jgi:hypothetical protein
LRFLDAVEEFKLEEPRARRIAARAIRAQYLDVDSALEVHVLADDRRGLAEQLDNKAAVVNEGQLDKLTPGPTSLKGQGLAL